MTRARFVPHPGEELWGDWLDPLNVSVSAAARALGVSRKTMSQIVNGSRPITFDMSVRLSKALGTPLDYWATRQLAFDVSQVDGRQFKVKRLVPRDFEWEGRCE
jgi:antitoxin HigA-1